MMKKVTYLLVLAAAVVLASCSGKGSGNSGENDSIPGSEAEEVVEVADLTTPSGVVIESYKRLGNYDYEGFIDLFDMPAEFRKRALQSKDEAIRETKKKGGIDHVELLKEQINEKKGTAKVKVKVVCGNGEEGTDTHNLVRKKDGTWLMMLSVF